MRVVALAAGRSLSAARLEEVTSALGRAAGGPVEVHLFSWSPVERGAPVRTAAVLGPVKAYRPPHPAGPAERAVPQTRPAPCPDQDATHRAGSDGEVHPPNLVSLGRRVLGRGYRASRRTLVRLRRGPVYRRLRRAVRGDVGRQFAARARRDAQLAAVARGAVVVLSLDQNAVLAAWRIARQVPGPAVVQGLAAAERELRSHTRPSGGDASAT